MKEIIFGVISGIIAATRNGWWNYFDFAFEFIWKH